MAWQNQSRSIAVWQRFSVEVGMSSGWRKAIKVSTLALFQLHEADRTFSGASALWEFPIQVPVDTADSLTVGLRRLYVTVTDPFTRRAQICITHSNNSTHFHMPIPIALDPPPAGATRISA